MKCPICGTWTIVKETRLSTDNTRKRRLECANMHKFSTLELVIENKTNLRSQQGTAKKSSKS
jgi:transcriptional regulator NrdR family protein